MSDVVRHGVKQDRDCFYIQMLRKAIQKEEKVQAVFSHLTPTVVPLRLVASAHCLQSPQSVQPRQFLNQSAESRNDWMSELKSIIVLHRAMARLLVCHNIKKEQIALNL